MAKQLVKFNDDVTGARDPLTVFKLIQGQNFTIPQAKTVTSPTGDANLSSIVSVSGGQMLIAGNDGASGAAGAFDLTGSQVCDLYAGDVIAISAVVSNAATLSVTSVDGTVRSFVITGITTVAMAVGYFG